MTGKALHEAQETNERTKDKHGHAVRVKTFYAGAHAR